MAKYKKLSLKSLGAMSPARLIRLVEKTRQELESLKFDLAIDKLSDYSQIKKKKSDLARVLTILNQKILNRAREK